MTQVFISYSRSDLAFVEGLAADLKEVGLDVWYDLSGLEGGSRWSREIEKAIRDSQYVLVVLSPDSVASKWVEEEFLFASELGKKIVPLFYRQCSIPFGYRTLHFINIQEEKYKKNFGEILRALSVKPVVPKKPPAPVDEKASSKNLTEEPETISKPEPKKTNLKVNRRAIIGLFGLAAIVIVGIFGFPYVADMFSKQPESLATATQTQRPFNTTEVAFMTHVAPSPTPQTATGSVLRTNIAGGSTQITPNDQLPTEITDEFGVEMVLVPDGNFFMGTDDGDTDEKPVHELYLNAYYIDKYEVTNGSYLACVNAGICSPPKGLGSYTRENYFGVEQYSEYPVVFIDWNMANRYCIWRNAHLPTESEWEKAARDTVDSVYPWGEKINCSYLNYASCTGDTTSVGSYENGKSVYGVYDMAGNVWEWISSLYQPYPYSNTDGRENHTAIGGRVIRGGSWSLVDNDVRASNRDWVDPSSTTPNIGFRCAKDATP